MIPCTETPPAGGAAGRAAPRGTGTVCQLVLALGIGGAEILAARMARQLRGGYRFVFACLDEAGPLGDELRAEGFPVHVLGRRPGVDWGCARRLARLLRRERVDVVHAHQYTPFFYAASARLPGPTPPVLFTEHGRWYPDRPRPKRVAANRLLLRRRDRVVGVGGSVREALIRNEGLPAGRVAVVHNGIEPSRFRDERADERAIRAEMGVGPDDLVVLQVARLDHLKDHGTAVAAIAEVARRRPEARLVLVGEGPERGKIEDLVRRLGVGERVRLLGLRTDIPRLLRAADLFLLSSVSEGIPLTIIEAMAAGLPVVATAVGGVPEVVEDGRTGWLVPSGDHAALTAAVLRVAEDPGARARMGRLGRERAEAMFSERRMLDAYRRLYDEMIGG